MGSARHCAFAPFTYVLLDARIVAEDGPAISSLPPGSARSPGTGLSSPSRVLSTEVLRLRPFMIKHVSPSPKGGPVVFTVKENRKSCPPERHIKLGIGWLGLFLFDLFGLRRGAIVFVESSLSSLFLLFLARQFFSPLFAFIGSSMFWQSTLPTLKEFIS